MQRAEPELRVGCRYRAVIALVIAAYPLFALAGPSDYVYVPNVTYGEREIDFKMGTWRNDGRQSAASVGFGYGVTQRWFTEVYRKYERSDDEGTHFDAWEWENKFQLTETGQYPLDVGFIVEIEKPANTQEGYELRFGPLVQAEIGKIQLNANLIVEQHYRSDTSQRAQLSYQYQAKYRWQPQFEFGLQGFGDAGSPNHWDEVNSTSNRVGPAVFGKVNLGIRRAIRYNAAWLMGTSGNAPQNNVRAQVEYEF
jgi:hypothetical protein